MYMDVYIYIYMHVYRLREVLNSDLSSVIVFYCTVQESAEVLSTVTFLTETTTTDHTPSHQQLENSDNLSQMSLEQAQVYTCTHVL